MLPGAIHTKRAAALLASAALAAFALTACGSGDAGGSKSDSAGKTASLPTGPGDTASQAQIDDFFFARFAKALTDDGKSTPVTDCMEKQLRKTATRAELDEVEAGGSSLSLARKANTALNACAKSAGG